MHCPLVDVLGPRVFFQEHWRDVVRFAGIGKSEERARARDHAMPLVLAVCGMADFLREGVGGVLQRTHHGGVNADVQSFEAIEITGGVEKTINSFGIGASGFGQAHYGAIGVRHYVDRIMGIIKQA